MFGIISHPNHTATIVYNGVAVGTITMQRDTYREERFERPQHIELVVRGRSVENADGDYVFSSSIASAGATQEQAEEVYRFH